MCPQVIHDHRLAFLCQSSVLLDPFQQIMCSDIGGHDQNGILKVHRTALGIGNTPVIQHL